MPCNPVYENAYKAVLVILGVLLIGLQYLLWFGKGGLIAVWDGRVAVRTQASENASLAERNQVLEAEVEDLRDGLAAIEERARAELGMIRQGETFFQIIPPPDKSLDE